eukprot:3468763-Rhodomonas_salina.4
MERTMSFHGTNDVISWRWRKAGRERREGGGGRQTERQRGFGVWQSGCRVWGLGPRVHSLGPRVHSLGPRVHSLGPRV